MPLKRRAENKNSQFTIKATARNNSAAILAMVEASGVIGGVLDFSARAALAAGRVLQGLPNWQSAEPDSGSVHAV